MIATADYNHEDFEPRNASKADEGLMVKFYTASLPDKAASAEEGRPMFKDVECVDIKVPGQRDGVARPASHQDKLRFPAHYRAFKDRTAAPSEGTPLTEWALVTRSLADQLTFMNIKTVEQLAEVADSNLHQMQGLVGLKQKAADWLENAKEEGLLAKLRAELEERDASILTLNETLEKVMARLEQLEAE